MQIAEKYVKFINRSYMIGFNDPDWGERTYFTFFGEFQRQSAVQPIIEVLILAVIFIVAMVGNSLVLVVMVRARHKASGYNYCVANLAVAGITYTLCLPLEMVTRITETWVFGRVPCSFMLYSMFSGDILTVWTMTIISFDRFRCTRKKPPMSCRTVLALLVMLWIVALLASSPLGVYFVERVFPLGERTVRIYTLVWPNTKVRISILFTSPAVLVLILLPLVMIVVNYTRVMLTLRRSVRRWRRDGSDDVQKSRDRQEIRVVRLLIVLVVLFCLTRLPIGVSFLLILWDGLTDTMMTTSQLFVASMALAMANGSVDPFIYTSVNKSCKKGVARIVERVVKVCGCRLKGKSRVPDENLTSAGTDNVAL